MTQQSSSVEGRMDFSSVYDAQVSRIYRYHYYRTRHRETAEDLTSQTFLKAFEAFSRFDPTRASVSTWLYRIARNTLIDSLRARHPSDQIEDAADFLASKENVEREASVREELEHVRAALVHLTPAQREVVLLRLWDDMTYADIADVTGKSEDACKMAFSRGLASLRKHAGPAALALLLIPLLQ